MPPRNGKNSSTIRRILSESKELAVSDGDIYAAPTEDNLFEWHFVIRGPPASPYENGCYHGRINLPSNYPLAPPSFRFLQDTGRFEVNREICLSISNFHAEEWLPAWGVRTALVALRTFMVTSAEGAAGSIDGVPEVTRRQIAGNSSRFVCPRCGKRNDELLTPVVTADGNEQLSGQPIAGSDGNESTLDLRTAQRSTDPGSDVKSNGPADSRAHKSRQAEVPNHISSSLLSGRAFLWTLLVILLIMAFKGFY